MLKNYLRTTLVYFLNQKAFTSDFTLNTASFKTKYYLKNKQENEDFSITFVDTGIDTLPGERLLRCKKYIPEKDDYFMATYGDGVSDINIKELVRFHKKQKTIGTLSGVHPRSKYGLIKMTKNNIVNFFEEKPVLSDWVNGGYMVFSKKFFDYIEPGGTELAALAKLSMEKQLSMYRHNGFWFGIDTYKELEDLNAIWNSGNPPWKIWK